MKIAFHVHKLELAGAERQLFYLASGLAAAGHEVHILSLYSGGKLEADFRAVSGVTISSLGRSGKFDFRCIYRLVRYVQNEGIEIIQGWMRPCNTFAAIAALLTGRSGLLCVRQSTAASLSGSGLYLKVDRQISNWFSIDVVYNSYAGKNNHLEIGFNAENARVIPNGIAIPHDKHIPQAFSSLPICTLGIISRIELAKGHLELFEALSILKKGGYQAKLQIYGSGAEETVDYLRAAADSLGVSKDIYWNGFIEDSWESLGQIDVLVSASHTEGMSNTILEGMLAARPIVATNVGDSARMLSDNTQVCGKLVSKKAPEELARAIGWMIDNPEAAIELGGRAKSLCESRYALGKMVADYERLYEGLIKG